MRWPNNGVEGMIDIETIEAFVSSNGSHVKSVRQRAKDISDLVIAARSKHSMSQRALADYLKVRQATVSRWELCVSVPGPWELQNLIRLYKDDPKPAKKTFRARTVVRDAGLSIRDQFAMAALPAIIQNKGIQTAGVAAETAYQVADAMLKHRGDQ